MTQDALHLGLPTLLGDAKGGRAAPLAGAREGQSPLRTGSTHEGGDTRCPNANARDEHNPHPKGPTGGERANPPPSLDEAGQGAALLLLLHGLGSEFTCLAAHPDRLQDALPLVRHGTCAATARRKARGDHRHTPTRPFRRRRTVIDASYSPQPPSLHCRLVLRRPASSRPSGPKVTGISRRRPRRRDLAIGKAPRRLGGGPQRPPARDRDSIRGVPRRLAATRPLRRGLHGSPLGDDPPMPAGRRQHAACPASPSRALRARISTCAPPSRAPRPACGIHGLADAA